MLAEIPCHLPFSFTRVWGLGEQPWGKQGCRSPGVSDMRLRDFWGLLNIISLGDFGNLLRWLCPPPPNTDITGPHCRVALPRIMQGSGCPPYPGYSRPLSCTPVLRRWMLTKSSHKNADRSLSQRGARGLWGSRAAGTLQDQDLTVTFFHPDLLSVVCFYIPVVLIMFLGCLVYPQWQQVHWAWGQAWWLWRTGC